MVVVAAAMGFVCMVGLISDSERRFILVFESDVGNDAVLLAGMFSVDAAENKENQTNETSPFSCDQITLGADLSFRRVVEVEEVAVEDLHFQSEIFHCPVELSLEQFPWLEQDVQSLRYDRS